MDILTGDGNCQKLLYHYENMPIQKYREFYHQKMKTFRCQNSGSFRMSAH